MGGFSSADLASSSMLSSAAVGFWDLMGLSSSAFVNILRILSPTVMVRNSMIRNTPMTMLTKVAAATMGPLKSVVYEKTHRSEMKANIRTMMPMRPPRRR